jgi:hypothetical protein
VRAAALEDVEALTAAPPPDEDTADEAWSLPRLLGVLLELGATVT